MARFKYIDGEKIPLTQAEETACDAEQAAWLAAKPARDKAAANAAILAEIAAKELSTLRALRDSARGLGNAPDAQGKTPRQRLDESEAEIAALRAGLVP